MKALHEIACKIPDLAFQGVYRIMHLIVLLEEKDIRGLESFSTNYKRHLKTKLPGSEPAMTLVKLLSRPANLESGDALQETLKTLLAHLDTYQQSSDTTFKPFFHPMATWATKCLASLKVVQNYNA